MEMFLILIIVLLTVTSIYQAIQIYKLRKQTIKALTKVCLKIFKEEKSK